MEKVIVHTEEKLEDHFEGVDGFIPGGACSDVFKVRRKGAPKDSQVFIVKKSHGHMEFLAHEELESLKIASGNPLVVKLYECFDRRTQ